MRLNSLAVMLAALTLPPLAAPAQQKVDIRRAATTSVSVRLNGALGNVHVQGWDRDSVVMTGTLPAGSRLEGGPQYGEGPVTGMKFYVEATDQVSEHGNKLELRVPRNARVWIKAGSADIDVSSINGGLDLNIIGGSIRVNGKPRELIIESMDGSVDVGGFADYARIKTATGDITMHGRGDDVSLTSISGNIAVADGSVQRGHFESVTGSVTYAGDVARGGEVRFDTHSGAIELRLSGTVGAEIDAATITGTIENGLTPRRPIAGREGRGMELATSSGTGGARVVIRSFKGNVKLAPQ